MSSWLTARQRGTSQAERVLGTGTDEDSATSGPGDGGGSPPATEGKEGRLWKAPEFGWHHEVRFRALVPTSVGQERFF